MGYPLGDSDSLGGIILKQRFDNFHPSRDLVQAFMVQAKMADHGFYRFDLGTLIDYEHNPPVIVKYVASFATLTPMIGFSWNNDEKALWIGWLLWLWKVEFTTD